MHAAMHEPLTQAPQGPPIYPRRRSVDTGPCLDQACLQAKVITQYSGR